MPKERELSMKNKLDSELTLTNYASHYVHFAFVILVYLIVLYSFVLPAFYTKNLFWPFTELYATKNYLALLGVLAPIGISAYHTFLLITTPFKIIFSEEGIHIYSLYNLESYFIKWEDLTELQFIKVIKRRYQVETEFMKIVIRSDQYSTKVLGSLGPTFNLKDFKNNNIIIRDQILELYRKECPRLANSESLLHE